ncbi:hypothetical protein K469DRAFT_748855 [Zopfia rhizophila CBS 207.26]|uniref:Uncharacterized protein n=1 Tax=Zopfia rhizophila CBS 207.26 TaxID=1314779 RepID=A0A6A6EAN9_9PEZI|nr:hypothetical protein K469DRAFT_748855 [Zopfia rhizophila CBS 207.26]
MRIFNFEFLCASLLLLTGVDALPSTQLAKRALSFDASCNTKYGKLTAKQYLEKSMDLMPDMAKSGKDALDKVVEQINWQLAGSPEASKPNMDVKDWSRIKKTYFQLFGELTKDNFMTEAPKHVSNLKLVQESLSRMMKSRRPDLIIHCNDDWLKEENDQGAAGKPPTEPKLKGPSYKWLYDTDRKEWIQKKGGKPCKGRKSAVTFINDDTDKRQERITFCKAYFDIQAELEKDGQPQIWDLDKKNLPAKFKNYASGGVTEDFHVSAFGRKFGTKWFHEFQHTHLFNPKKNEIKDQEIAGGPDGAAYTWEWTTKLAKQKGNALATRNVENILYWCITMYFDEYKWSTGNPVKVNAPAGIPAPAAGEKRAAAKPKPPKTQKPADPPKSTKAADPPKSTKAADPPKSSETPSRPSSTQAPNSSRAVSSASASKSSVASSGITSASVSRSVSSSSMSITSSASCSSTLCTLTTKGSSSSASSTSSGRVAIYTDEAEAIGIDDMKAAAITAVAASIASAELTMGDGVGFAAATGGDIGTIGTLRPTGLNATWTVPTLSVTATATLPVEDAEQTEEA